MVKNDMKMNVVVEITFCHSLKNIIRPINNSNAHSVTANVIEKSASQGISKERLYSSILYDNPAGSIAFTHPENINNAPNNSRMIV